MMPVFERLARYNAVANEAMLGVMNATGSKFFDEPVDGYYHSVHEILAHLHKADQLVLSEIAAAIGKERCGNEAALSKDPPISGLSRFSVARSELDACFLKLVSVLGEGDLAAPVRKTTRSGEITERPVWVVLTHCFNHQTHHRGQVAQILDSFGVVNDYSGMLYLEQP
jgi:uncharacterized damage-inducible protein DinB